MLDKKQAEKISQWTNHQQVLMKYGQFAKSSLTKEEVKALRPERDEKFINSVILTPCVICMTPNKTEDKFYPEFWLQVKGWYGQEKSWVCFSPNGKEEIKTFLKIAKKHLSSATIKEEVNYFPY